MQNSLSDAQKPGKALESNNSWTMLDSKIAAHGFKKLNKFLQVDSASSVDSMKSYTCALWRA